MTSFTGTYKANQWSLALSSSQGTNSLVIADLKFHGMDQWSGLNRTLITARFTTRPQHQWDHFLAAIVLARRRLYNGIIVKTCIIWQVLFRHFLIQGLGFTNAIVTNPTTPVPPAIPTAILRPTLHQKRCSCSYDCPGSYKMNAVCKDGDCACTGQGYDYNTCLRKVFLMLTTEQMQRPCSDTNINWCVKET